MRPGARTIRNLGYAAPLPFRRTRSAHTIALYEKLPAVKGVLTTP